MGGPQAWGLGVGLTILRHKINLLRIFHLHVTHKTSAMSVTLISKVKFHTEFTNETKLR
jgi:hypothetical protein